MNLTETPAVEQTEYRPIQGYPGYRVGSDGSVWSNRSRGAGKTGGDWRRMSDKPKADGRVYVNLYGDGGVKRFLSYTLVLTAFVGPRPKGMEGCHNNGIPADNRLSNLRWDTKKGNMADMVLHGTHNRGERHVAAKLSESDVIEIKKLLREGVMTQKEIGEIYGLCRGTVSSIHRGRKWKHVTEPHTN